MAKKAKTKTETKAESKKEAKDIEVVVEKQPKAKKKDVETPKRVWDGTFRNRKEGTK